MKKVMSVILFSTCLILVFSNCKTSKKDHNESEKMAMEAMEKFGQIDYVSVKSDYDNYKTWNMVTKDAVTGDPFGVLGGAHATETGFRKIYINDIGKKVSMGKKDYPYPVGTILAKDNFMGVDGVMGDLAVITFMVKRGEGYDPENGNWEYVRVSPQYDIQAQGKAAGCISCHANAKDTDFVFYNMR